MSEDKEYFQSYAWLPIHCDMLQDTSRTLAYRSAILSNPELIKGKAVMDVGAGTAILSLFAAQAGARVVYAIEASQLAEHTREIIKLNGFGDVIKLINKRVEDLTPEDIPEPIDVIVSEWMGYFMLYESMLPSVLHARDRFCRKPQTQLAKPIMMPNIARLFLAPCSHEKFLEERIDFWEDVYGFNMETLKDLSQLQASKEPDVETVAPSDIVADPVVIFQFDCESGKVETLSNPITAEFSFKFYGMCDVVCFASWFEVQFHGDIVLSTSPNSPETHWAQTLFYLPKSLPVEQDDQIQGTICITRNQVHQRCIDVKLDWRFLPGPHSTIPGFSQTHSASIK